MDPTDPDLDPQQCGKGEWLHDRKAFLGWEAVKNESAGKEGALHEVEKREGGAAREQDHGGAAQAGPHSLQQNRVKGTSHEINFFFSEVYNFKKTYKILNQNFRGKIFFLRMKMMCL